MVLPPGQKARNDFPRFGLPQYADRFPSKTTDLVIELEINGQGIKEIDLSSHDIPRSTIKTDFHCVTTWSYVGAEWGGVRVSDLVESLSLSAEMNSLVGVILSAQDGYKTSLLIEDLLGEDVMLADTLDGHPLSIEHGAPVRLIAPKHYGYKNLKHLKKIEFHSELPVIKRGFSAFLDHPRARVSKEERGRWVPGWILRFLYRMMITGTVKDFDKAMQQYRADGDSGR